MIRILKSAALATLIGIGTLAAAPATAQAEGIYLNFGSHQDSRFGAHMRDRNVHRGWYPEGPRRRFCTAGQALDKARRMGLHRARIFDEGRRTIKVSGRKLGERVVVAFGRQRGCPVRYY